MERIIGRYTGQQKGPLLIALGGIHGNEPAGLRALELIMKMLEVEPITNPSFRFNGRLLALRGNLAALQSGQRFIDKDLNRNWTEENVARIRSSPATSWDMEDREIASLLHVIDQEIADYRPERIVVLDLHTTTADGGIFSIATDDPESLEIAIELHAPVIRGILAGINGTILHYFNKKRYGPRITAVGFESGQHYDPLSINRAIAAITNCMRTIGCVNSKHVENRHDELLIEYSKDLPKVADFITAHTIRAGDDFRMKEGYQNFGSVRKGEILAYDRHGPITAVEDGLVLMPLYQPQGEDGFFLIRAVQGY